MSFQYRPLSRDRREIRLLRIIQHNASITADGPLIECSVEHAFLDKDLEYVALSYTWGDPKATLPVTLNGHLFQVTENLHTALCELENDFRTTLLWVDAICIN